MCSTAIDDRITSPPLPGATFRSIASFLLFVHLFALAVVISSNWGPQSEPSQIRRDVRGKLWPLTAYTQILHMDSGYNFYYTYGGVLDVDHVLTSNLSPSGDPSADGETVQLPETGLWPALRRRRLLRLNLAVASQLDNDAAESLFPRAAGAHLLAKSDATETMIRYHGILLQRPQDVGDSDPVVADPLAPAKFRTIYEAQVWLDDNGKVQLLKSTLPEGGAQQAGPAVSAPPSGPAPNN